MSIKDIAPIIAQVTDHFGSDIFIPISTFSSHAQSGAGWKFIMKFPGAVSKYPFRSIRNAAKLDLGQCNLNGEFRLCTPHPDLPSIVTHRLAFLSQIVPVRWRDLIFVCFDWILYTSGPIPAAELSQLANLLELILCENHLTGTPSLFTLICLNIKA